MSIRLRFTLLYNAILALTLAVFGIALYSIQARTTLDALKRDLLRSSEMLRDPLLNINPPPGGQPPSQQLPGFFGRPGLPQAARARDRAHPQPRRRAGGQPLWQR